MEQAEPTGTTESQKFEGKVSHFMCFQVFGEAINLVVSR